MANHAAPTPEFDRVIEDVRQERHHQIADGWTPEHDDRCHRPEDLVWLATDRATDPGVMDRHRIVQAITLMVAAVERFDRIEAAQ